ncbi:MAG TPA: hypothetical protein VJ625_13475 [Propionibacteriaceae bacterium]|nr:hypothetical protein [Propionibacteriaceae bacterium]
MGTTGVIFAAIAIAWLAYLVPHFVRRRDGDEELDDLDPVDRFSDSMRIVRHGTAPLLDHDLEEIAPFEVSTPQTRHAAINDLRRLERLAASRRSRVLLSLLAMLSGVIGFCAVHLVPWWSTAIPGGLLLIFVLVAPISVRIMRKSLDARYREIHQGGTESTIFLSRKDFPKTGIEVRTAGGKSDLAAKPGVLWDPIPITMPTYVSKPLAPRTVRTIDLSGPGVATSARQDGPVTADAPASASDSPSALTGEETRKSASA